MAINKPSDHKNTQLQCTNRIQVFRKTSCSNKIFIYWWILKHIHTICSQHGRDIRQSIEIKLQSIFNQVRDEYEQQCGHLLTTIERDINQMNSILQDINTKCDSTPLITNDSMSNLIKQAQRIDLITKNFEYDWQMIKQSGSKIFLIKYIFCLSLLRFCLKFSTFFS